MGRPDAHIEVAVMHPDGSVACQPFAHVAGMTVGDVMGRTEALGDTMVGVWGHKRPLDWPLLPGDRVEVYAPLKIDPKVVRKRKADATPRRGWVARVAQRAKGEL